MRSHLVFATLAAAFLAPAAAAQENWAGLPIAPGNGNTTLGPGPGIPKTTLFGGEGVLVSCFSTGGFPTGIPCPQGTVQSAYVPLSEFARSSTVVGLSERVNALDGEVASVAAGLQGLTQQVDGLNKSVALSSALDIMLPVNGEQNRLGLQVTDIAGENGLGLSYSHVSGNIDVGVSLAAVGPERAGKVGIGFSW